MSFTRTSANIFLRSAIAKRVRKAQPGPPPRRETRIIEMFHAECHEVRVLSRKAGPMGSSGSHRRKRSKPKGLIGPNPTIESR